MASLGSHRFYLVRPAASVAIAALVTAALPSRVTAITSYPYEDRAAYEECAADLLELEVSPEAALTACASALHPEEVGDCVVGIATYTEIAPADALASCRRSRRPDELSTCVVDITDNLENALPIEVLDNCRRSLLPLQYSNCVLGLDYAANLAPAEALIVCISAGDRPRDLAPSFIPRLQAEPEGLTDPRLTPLVPFPQNAQPQQTLP